MIGNHALCRHCGHVVRVDWEICFHCGVRRPVARSLSAVGFRVTSALLLVCLVFAAAFNVAAVWNLVRGAPAALVAGVAKKAPAVAAGAGEAVPEIPVPEIDASTIVDPAQRVASGALVTTPRPPEAPMTLPRPTLPQGPALSISSDAADTLACGLPRAALAGAALDAGAVSRAIGACRSVEELDSLVARVRSTRPGAAALEQDGRLARRIQARRAALAGH